jgi:hypothetical protein
MYGDLPVPVAIGEKVIRIGNLEYGGTLAIGTFLSTLSLYRRSAIFERESMASYERRC